MDQCNGDSSGCPGRGDLRALHMPLIVFRLAFRWAEAHAKATEMVNEIGGFLVHPFDLPDIWEGHASLVLEIKRELEHRGVAKPSAIFVRRMTLLACRDESDTREVLYFRWLLPGQVSVGGGGLILGDRLITWGRVR